MSREYLDIIIFNTNDPTCWGLAGTDVARGLSCLSEFVDFTLALPPVKQKSDKTGPYVYQHVTASELRTSYTQKIKSGYYSKIV